MHTGVLHAEHLSGLATHVDDLAKLGIGHAFGGPYLRVGALKAFADGSLGSGTAYFYEPFLNQGNNRGLLSDEMHPISLMRDRYMKADAGGLQICTHAIGDAGISTILDLYTELIKAHGKADRRLRIEHAQHMAAKDFERFAQLHVIASVQPYHAIDDGRWAEKELGTERIQSSYAWRLLLDHGAVLAFGSDWPVAPLDPLLGIYAAATRRTLDGKNLHGWVTQQRITVAEAVHAYTVGSAFAEHQEQIKGSLEPGKLADLAVLTDDVFRIAPTDLDKVRVYMTVFDGRVIYHQAAQP